VKGGTDLLDRYLRFEKSVPGTGTSRRMSILKTVFLAAILCSASSPSSWQVYVEIGESDLIGMGDAGKLPDSGPACYRFVEGCGYLGALLKAPDVLEWATFASPRLRLGQPTQRGFTAK
jgi:hypothetical protein